MRANKSQFNSKQNFKSCYFYFYNKFNSSNRMTDPGQFSKIISLGTLLSRVIFFCAKLHFCAPLVLARLNPSAKSNWQKVPILNKHSTSKQLRKETKAITWQEISKHPIIEKTEKRLNFSRINENSKYVFSF